MPFRLVLRLRSSQREGFAKRRALRGVRLDDDTAVGERGAVRWNIKCCAAYSVPAPVQYVPCPPSIWEQQLAPKC